MKTQLLYNVKWKFSLLSCHTYFRVLICTQNCQNYVSGSDVGSDQHVGEFTVTIQYILRVILDRAHKNVPLVAVLILLIHRVNFCRDPFLSPYTMTACDDCLSTCQIRRPAACLQRRPGTGWARIESARHTTAGS